MSNVNDCVNDFMKDYIKDKELLETLNIALNISHDDIQGNGNHYFEKVVKEHTDSDTDKQIILEEWTRTVNMSHIGPSSYLSEKDVIRMVYVAIKSIENAVMIDEIENYVRKQFFKLRRLYEAYKSNICYKNDILNVCISFMSDRMSGDDWNEEEDMKNGWDDDKSFYDRLVDHYKEFQERIVTYDDEQRIHKILKKSLRGLMFFDEGEMYDKIIDNYKGYPDDIDKITGYCDWYCDVFFAEHIDRLNLEEDKL